MDSNSIVVGDLLLVEDAFGGRLRVKAASRVEQHSGAFPIVWVERPLRDGTVDRVPWPLEAIRMVAREVDES